MNREQIEHEIRGRAERQLAETRLVSDYYRVRRRVAWPLPVRSLDGPQLALSGRYPPAEYPWGIWMLWALDERLGALGWAGDWFGDDACRDAVRAELSAMADWPSYCDERNVLSYGHAARRMATARRRWDWLGDETAGRLDAALARMIDEWFDLFVEKYAAFESVDAVLADHRDTHGLHNIPLIGSMGMAMAANVTGDARAEAIDARLAIALRAWLDRRERGYTEGVAYDGYVHDFAIPWAETRPADDGLLAHPQFARLLDESCMLGAPGAMMNVARIGDVEPREMPFHASAHARRFRLRPTAAAAWYLRRCDPSWLPADGLGDLHAAADALADAAPPAGGALDAHYALVLRSGWDLSDLAVTAACCNAPMGHMHEDNGSLVIGTGGQWLIDDPGYQQYLKSNERAFTLGVSAHNAVVINGQAQARKRPRRLTLGSDDAGRPSLALELADCYDLPVDSVTRTVWLGEGGLVVAADRVAGAGVASLAWHWHGHPDAAWWLQDGRALVYLGGVTLHIACPTIRFAPGDVDRLPGSRGHLTLTATSEPAELTWWVFALGDDAPSIETDGDSITVNGQRFAV